MKRGIRESSDGNWKPDLVEVYLKGKERGKAGEEAYRLAGAMAVGMKRGVGVGRLQGVGGGACGRTSEPAGGWAGVLTGGVQAGG